jgi:hypothetical protein
LPRSKPRLRDEKRARPPRAQPTGET